MPLNPCVTFLSHIAHLLSPLFNLHTTTVQTLITEQQGKDLIQECLKADDDDEDVDDRAEGASEEDLPDDADGADYSEDDASES